MTKLPDELALLDASSQAALVRHRQVSAIELVEAAITRIEALNPVVNAVVTKTYETAVEIAKSRLRPGPLSGVPFVVKDLVAECAGVRHTEGSRFLQHYVSKRDQELVERYRRAGLIIVGKTNTPEFGILPITEPLLFGPTRNPWSLAHSPGGSSGGSAAAVAAGLVPIAHGNDGAGSIRIPSSCTGLFGLKPTRARNSLAPQYGDIMSGLLAEHVLTRSVQDSAALLDATNGPAMGDPYYASPAHRLYRRQVGAKPPPLRIGLTTVPFNGVEVNSDCIAVAEETAKLLDRMGHRIVQLPLPDLDSRALTRAFMTVWTSGVAWTTAYWTREVGTKPRTEDLEPLTWAINERSKRFSAKDYLLAIEYLQSFSRAIASLFSKIDVWLTPTLAQPPPEVGSFNAPEGDPLYALRRSASYMAFTFVANITGQPAMSVPLGWNRSGLPIGSHFTGRYGDESTLLRLAAQLEEARPWARRVPPTFATGPAGQLRRQAGDSRLHMHPNH